MAIMTSLTLHYTIGLCFICQPFFAFSFFSFAFSFFSFAFFSFSVALSFFSVRSSASRFLSFFGSEFFFLQF
jgi:hypothetical protein